MAIKKSELYSSLWKSCDELRGSMDASQYKDYVLVLLFMKYVSDKAACQKDYVLTVPKGGRFEDMVAQKGKKEIGDRINKIIARLAEENELKGVIDVADFNDSDKLGRGQQMVDRLSRLVGIFEGLDFGRNRADGDDLLGDAYEYLMRHFATESGKSKGQFYTPAEVSRIMAQVAGLGEASSQRQSIYDPACGSGSLLIKAHDEARHQTGYDLAIFGQEMDNATRALARMNTILHGCETAEVEQGNTLADPHFKTREGLRTFDFVVANPPFSTKAWSSGFNPEEDQFRRFPYGLPPAKNGDYAFLLHILASLKSSGKGACILPHGVLFRGGAEAVIRREVVRRGFIKGIIGLPANLFYGTGIPACIIVLDKADAAARKGIFMVDASKGFRKDGNKNRLRAQDIHRIVDSFTRRLEMPGYSRMVPMAEISSPKNDFNLNLPRYIDGRESEDLQDIDAHLRGGIPNRDVDALERFWKVFPGIRKLLFESAGRPGYSRLTVPIGELKAAIFTHPEFAAFDGTVARIFEKWNKAAMPRLVGIKRADAPKELIEALSEEMLQTFARAALIDPYDVYQRLMDYWDETMQDDLYLLTQQGWKAMLDGMPNTDLIPAELVSRRYFAGVGAALERLESESASISARLEELDQEHAGEEGLLAEARTEKGKLTRGSVSSRLDAVEVDAETREERAVLKQCLELIEAEAAAARKVKESARALDELVSAKYPKLDIDAIQTLVIHDKWLATLAAAVQVELDHVSQTLTRRIRELAERYATPLPALVGEVESLSARVDEHLKQAAMQQLLTGRHRLPGFTGTWREAQLGDVGSFSKGQGIRKDQVVGEGLPCIRYGEIYTRHHDIVRSFYSFIPPDVARQSQRLRKGDLLFAGSGETAEEIGKCVAFLGDEEAYAGGDIVIFSPRGQDSRYLGYLMNHSVVVEQKARLAQGDAVVHISARSLSRIRLSLPTLAEQRAIATVLSDMDAELSALEARLVKTRALKAGMMQKLLTGRIRLVEPRAGFPKEGKMQ